MTVEQSQAAPRPEVDAATSWDSVLDGSVPFRQPKAGYRVNVDSVLLAAFVSGGPVRRRELVVDLGAGVGILPLLLSRFGVGERFALVEREPTLAALAEQNVAHAGLDARVFVADVGAGLPAELEQQAGLVVCNPPFYDATHQRPARQPERARARHGVLGPFLRAAAAALTGSKARAVFVYPTGALPELFGASEQAGLAVKRLRLVHPFLARPARVGLVELRRARPGALVVEAPLIEWQSPGVPGPELSALTTIGRK